MIFGNVKLFQLPGWRCFVFVFAIATLYFSLWSFAKISDEVSEGDFHAKEQQWIRELRTTEDPAKPIGPDWLIQAGLDITALGSPIVLTLLTSSGILFLLLEDQFSNAFFVLISVAGGTWISWGLKLFFRRDRPEIVPHLVEVTSFSYPSGHSMLSAVVYLTLTMSLTRVLKRRWIKVYVMSLALGLTFLIGISRVYLGVHYPTDVFAGWAAGTAWATLCWLAADTFENKKTGDIEAKK